MGYTRPNTYALLVCHLSMSPLDSTIYYFGSRIATAGTFNGYYRAYVPRKGFIRSAYILQESNTATGTNENQVMAIRINDTTDYTFATVGAASNRRLFSNGNLNIPVNEGDYIEIKWTTPAWATNPDGTESFGYILIECY